MTLFLERVIRRGRAFEHNLVRVDLQRLLGLRRQDHAATHTDGAADIELYDLREI